MPGLINAKEMEILESFVQKGTSMHRATSTVSTISGERRTSINSRSHRKLPLDVILAAGESIAQLAAMLKENHIDKVQLIQQLTELERESSEWNSREGSGLDSAHPIESKIPPNNQFTLKTNNIFKGEPKTVFSMQRPHKQKKLEALKKLEAFYCDPNATEVYHLHEGLFKWRPPLELKNYERLLREDKDE